MLTGRYHSERLFLSRVIREKAANSQSWLLAAFISLLTVDCWAATQNLTLGLLIRGQIEDHQGVSKAESQPIEDSASLPLAQVYLEGAFASRSDIYVAFQSDDTQLKLQEAYVGYLTVPEQNSTRASSSQSR
ncbi:hypothetical protein ABMA58_03280, partial [Oceanospirillum sp. HFRX-1_2]